MFQYNFKLLFFNFIKKGECILNCDRCVLSIIANRDTPLSFIFKNHIMPEVTGL